MLHVGLTGGIASGKSTVSALLRELGAAVIDLDALAHAAEEPGGAAWQGIVDHFGRGVLRADGTIDREMLGEIVFRDPDQRAALNRIVHPAVFTLWRERLARLEAERPEGIVVSDVPLLLEAGMESLFDVVLLVYAPLDVQLRRLMTRNGFSEAQASSRCAAQMPIGDKIRHADFVIDNGGDPEETRRQTGEIWEELRRRERTPRLRGKGQQGTPETGDGTTNINPKGGNI